MKPENPAVNWVATLYNCTTDQVKKLIEHEVKTAVFQEETCPTTGRKHIQGFFKFNRRLRFTQVKNIFKDFQPHIEICKQVQKSIDYCSKNETRTGATVRIGCNETRDETIKNLVESGDIKTIRDKFYGFFLRHRRVLYEDMAAQYKPKTIEHTRGIWITGKPGSGKTRYVSNLVDTYWKSVNKWWDGYTGEKIVIMDDVDNKLWTWGIHYIKRWTDHYPILAEIKGGHVNLSHEWMIFTSNETLNESLYEITGVHKEAITRRFIEFNTADENWQENLNKLIV